MKILIAGAGAVGTHLARLLEQENHDITLIDGDKERLSLIRDNSEILTYLGNCTSLNDLAAAGVGSADLLLELHQKSLKTLTHACSPQIWVLRRLSPV